MIQTEAQSGLPFRHLIYAGSRLLMSLGPNSPYTWLKLFLLLHFCSQPQGYRQCLLYYTELATVSLHPLVPICHLHVQKQKHKLKNSISICKWKVWMLRNLNKLSSAKFRGDGMIVNVLTWKRPIEMFLVLLDLSGDIVERIWTTSLMVGLVSGSNSKHSLAKYAIICTSSSGKFPFNCGSTNSVITRLLSCKRGVA